VRLAVEKLREFIDEPDPNLKYLGLQALQELRLSHPRAVAEHKETIFACLQEGDYTIQTCALTLVRGMVNRRNLHDTVLHLMLTMRRAEQPFRDDIVITVLEMCGDDRYAMLTDFEWYISVLVELARVPETAHGAVIGQQLLDLTARVEAVREGAVAVLRPLILDPSLLEAKPANKTVASALLAAVYITGEHAQFVQNRGEMVEALLQPSIANLPAHVQQVYVQGLLKVFSRLGASMAAPQLLAGHGLAYGAGHLGLAGHNGFAYGSHGLVAGHGVAAYSGHAAVAAAPVAVAHAAPVAVAHAAPVAVAYHQPAVVAVPTATVHRTVETHLVPETRLVGHQVHQQVHHIPQVSVDTKTSTHTTHHVINHAPVIGAYAGHALPAGLVAGAVHGAVVAAPIAAYATNMEGKSKDNQGDSYRLQKHEKYQS